MKKLLILLLSLTAILISAGCAAPEPLLTGTVEANILPHYAEVGGKIVSAPLMLGQQVQAGDIVAVLDDRQERNNIEQLQATLKRKQAMLDELLAGADEDEQRQAVERRQANNNVQLARQSLAMAQTDLERAQQNYEEALLLYEQGIAPEKTLQDAQYRRDIAAEAINSATTRLDSARQQTAHIATGLAPEKIDAAYADIELTMIQLRQSEENLQYYTVRASQNGTVISKNYYTGAMVNAGYDLADIAAEEEKYVVAYIPEDRLYSISYGQSLTMRGNGVEYTGAIVFIDLKAQYTPKEEQTAANRNKNSYKIKILLPVGALWRPGETVEVFL